MDFEYELLYRFSPYLINEYCFCSKLFWLHFNKIRLFEENEEIQIGKNEHEGKEGESKNPWEKYDNLKGNVLIEYTKKKRNFEGKKNQLLCYMVRTGIHCGEIRDTNKDILYVKVEKTEENVSKLLTILSDMEKISEYEKPPNVKYSEKCFKCSFLEYCWVD